MVTPLGTGRGLEVNGAGQRRRLDTGRRFWLAAGFLAVVVGLGVAAVFVLPRSQPVPARRSPPPGHVPAARPSDAAGTGCRVPPGNRDVPAAAPAGVTWRLYATIALPFSATAGPAEVAGGVARCYAHSPTGALLAAVQIAVRYVLAPDWRAVLAQQVMPGTGRNVYAAQRPGMQVTDQPGQYGQVAGFQFAAYTQAVAVIQLATELPDGILQCTTMTVDWAAGDWRLVLQPDGAPGPDVQQLSSLTGFIPWSGV